MGVVSILSHSQTPVQCSTHHHKVALVYYGLLCQHHATYYAHECHLNDKS